MRAIGKIEGILEGVASNTQQMHLDLQIKNGRIGKLEEWKNQQVGEQRMTSIVYGSLSGILVSVLGYFLKK